MRGLARDLLFVCGIVSLAHVGACRRTTSGGTEPPPPPPTPALGPVVVEDFTPPPDRPPGVALDVPGLERRLRATLQAPGVFASAAPDAGGVPFARVRAEVALEEVKADAKAAARATVRLRIDTRPEGVAARRWNEDVQAGAETVFEESARTDRQALYQNLTGRALEDLAKTYTSRQRLWSGDAKAIAAALAPASAPETRIEAMRVVGERKLREHVPALLTLLDDADEQMRDTALGALVELREPQAVSVLARKRSMKDKREMQKILEAMATIGGEEATNYLAFVADGHEDEEIKQMAQAARQRLERRQAANKPK